MLFNSIEFIFFLPIVFILYWFVTNRNLKHQNILLLLASYFFYGWWDWRFLILIIFSSGIDFQIAKNLNKSKNEKNRKRLLWLSLLMNLGFLGFFKYFNFFAESFVEAYTLFGQPLDYQRLNIILPVGISFYTFQTLSYTIDVYKRNLEPSKDIISFFAFVSFFPQLVAGPIERATKLLPQFYTKREFNYNKAVDGVRQLLWGLFKKVVIADNCAKHCNYIFENYSELNGVILIFGALLFTFQIYCDFSGYSDMAIGISRLFGFNLMQNFRFPYFSRDIAEFWRRWHISLSTWFRDYLYIPLGGSRGSKLSQIRNVFIIFLVSGFWHGANWTFIFWGLLNAIYFLPFMLTNTNRLNTNEVAEGRVFPSLKEFSRILFTFSLTVLAWIFFRAKDLSTAFSYINSIISDLGNVDLSYHDSKELLKTLVLIFVLIAVEWFGRNGKHALETIVVKMSSFYRYSFYSLILLAILLLGGSQQDFIYFQF